MIKLKEGLWVSPSQIASIVAHKKYVDVYMKDNGFPHVITELGLHASFAHLADDIGRQCTPFTLQSPMNAELGMSFPQHPLLCTTCGADRTKSGCKLGNWDKCTFRGTAIVEAMLRNEEG